MNKFLLFFIAFIALSITSFAQGTYINMGTDAYRYIDRLDIKYGKIIPIEHTGDKPYTRGVVAKVAETLKLSNLRFSKVQQYQIQYLLDENAEWLDSLQSKSRKPLFKALYREPASFAHVSSKKKGGYDIRFNPVLDIRMGVESFDKRFVFQRTLGLEVRGNIKRVFSFYFNVMGNAARPPSYVADKAYRDSPTDYVFVPGQAYYKTYSSKIFKFNDGIDYFDARGYINLHILKHINLTFGRDKNFIGNGQRSLMLSDFSAPYLFLKLNVNIWRFNYTSIIAELNSQYIRGLDQLLPKKYMAVHHLSIQATHFLNIGLFEGVVYKRSNNFELQYLNPIIFYRTVEHSLGSPDNVLIGFDVKANIAKHAQFYSQIVLDEFNFKNAFKGNGWWANKWALQLGLKYIDLFPNFDVQLEANIVRPFTYSHGGEINYTHYNQPLAHPLGANFYEVILNLHYQPIPRLSLNAKYLMAVVGNDTVDIGSGLLTNYGGDIFRATGGNTVSREFGNTLGQGAKGTINYFQFLASYHAWHNIYIDADILYRSKSTAKSLNNPITNQSTFMFTIGARMNIPYKNYEF